MNRAINEIEMPFWQNPQSHIFVQYYHDEVLVYFDIWDKPAESINDQLGVIVFYDCFQVLTKKGLKKYFPNEISFRSSIFEIINSNELSEYLMDFQKYNHYNISKKLRHFVVNSHDFQLSIFASNYDFSLQNKSLENIQIFKKIFE